MWLIVAKDDDERERSLESALGKQEGQRLNFTAETYSSFCLEVETKPFLASSKTVILRQLEKLNKDSLSNLASYIDNPTPWINLYMSSSSLPFTAAVLKKIANVIHIKDATNWEREKREVEWVMGKAKERGMSMSRAVAQSFVQLVDKQSLLSELDKLICFLGDKREISIEAVHCVVTQVGKKTLWQLGDAIFGMRVKEAIEIGHVILGSELTIFPLLAHLYTQFLTMQKVLLAFLSSGKGEVFRLFPYLKGEMLDKKIMVARGYGQQRLKRGLTYIFEAELKARNSSIMPEVLLEMLLVRVASNLQESTIGSS